MLRKDHSLHRHFPDHIFPNNLVITSMERNTVEPLRSMSKSLSVPSLASALVHTASFHDYPAFVRAHLGSPHPMNLR